MRNKPFNMIFNIVAYLIAFLLIQTAAMLAINKISGLSEGMSLVISSAISSVATIVLFALCRWSPFSRDYIRSRPWFTLFWVILLACGSIIPSLWLLEGLEVDMPEETMGMFEQIMKEPWGYLSIGILVPVAEEMVFRGAVLRTLLQLFNNRWHWVAIIISALIFGALHGNLPQFIHGTLFGILLGWMYYRTDSIVPGIVFHWINNTIAFVGSNFGPQNYDAKLVDMFGNQQTVYLAIGFSLLIFLPSLFQVATRLSRPKKDDSSNFTADI
ncbi:MAG: CPBP family intramembrane metalloprotease [Prevotella sp.]|nr:CPBP family intramembrane metalloprotease [Prevotella sp.]